MRAGARRYAAPTLLPDLRLAARVDTTIALRAEWQNRAPANVSVRDARRLRRLRRRLVGRRQEPDALVVSEDALRFE